MFFEKKSPKKVKGGVKAHTKRGSFAQKWWSQRWIQALESFHDSARLGRGRTYARKGQVVSIEILQGKVRGVVQGTRKKPYNVDIDIDIFSSEAWRQLAEILSTQAFYAAKLLAGELPQDIENILEQSNYHLFPDSHNELKTDCTCPDWSNPCKHIAAVYYLIGEEFDRDPFLIFKMRGIERDDFLKMLQDERSVHVSEEADHEEQEDTPVPLPKKHQQFWASPETENFFVGDIEIPITSANIIKSLGKFPFWRGEHSLLETLQSVYSSASQKAKELLVDEYEEK